MIGENRSWVVCISYLFANKEIKMSIDGHDENEEETERKKLADETHPGFDITCQKCNSKVVMVEDSLGFSCQSGGWGAVKLICCNCHHSVKLYDSN